MTGLLNFSIVYSKVKFSCSAGPAIDSFPFFEMLLMRERDRQTERLSRDTAGIFLLLTVGR